MKKENPKSITDELSAQILEQIPTPVMAVDKNLKITYLNASGRTLLNKGLDEVGGSYCKDIFCTSHCGTNECRMIQAMEAGKRTSSRNEAIINDKKIPIEYTAVPLYNEKQELIGGLEFIVDITAQVINEEKLKEQSRTIREISTPAIKLWDGVVILPVVGVIDSLRAQQMMNAMLAKIMETSAKVIILDIQGVVAVDTAVANHLIKITKATKLMGCKCIISGISPAVAQTIVQLGVDLGDVNTNSTLSDALKEAFTMLKIVVSDSTL